MAKKTKIDKLLEQTEEERREIQLSIIYKALETAEELGFNAAGWYTDYGGEAGSDISIIAMYIYHSDRMRDLVFNKDFAKVFFDDRPVTNYGYDFDAFSESYKHQRRALTSWNKMDQRGELRPRWEVMLEIAVHQDDLIEFLTKELTDQGVQL